MEERSPDLLKPTLIAGVAFGAAASIPFVNLLNCFCCALIVGCGFLASYLYAEECRKQGVEFRPGKGALVGLVAGAFYAATSTLVGSVFHLLIGDVATRAALSWLQNLPNLPPEAADQIENAIEQASTFTIAGLILGFFFSVLLGAIFSTLGGLIGGATFKMQARPPGGAPGAPPAIP